MSHSDLQPPQPPLSNHRLLEIISIPPFIISINSGFNFNRFIICVILALDTFILLASSALDKSYLSIGSFISSATITGFL